MTWEQLKAAHTGPKNVKSSEHQFQKFVPFNEAVKNDDEPYSGLKKSERKVHKRVNNLDEIGPPEELAEAGLK